MKKILTLLLSVLMIAFSGCGVQKDNAEKPEKEKLSVVTTIFPPYDFAKEIAGDKADITMLLPFGGESHTYEPTLSDIALVADCDVFIYIGGDVDPWVESMINATMNSERRVIRFLDIIPVEEHHHSEKENHELADEHVWTSPKNAMEIVKVIAENICDADPKNTEFYTKNRAEYLEKLNLLHGEFRNIEKGDNTLLFADRFPFSHLCEEYGFSHVAAINGCSSDTEPTISAVNEIIKAVKEENTPAVLVTETADGSIAKTVADATGCEIRLLHSCHSISEAQAEDGEGYLSLMYDNLKTIKEVLAD